MVIYYSDMIKKLMIRQGTRRIKNFNGGLSVQDRGIENLSMLNYKQFSDIQINNKKKLKIIRGRPIN